MIPLASQEKRLHPRMFFKTPLQWKVRGEAKSINTSTNDISVGGLSFTCDEYIPPDTYLMLEFCMLQNRVAPIARVAWTNPMPYAYKYRCGVEFSEINEEHTQYLKDYFALKISS